MNININKDEDSVKLFEFINNLPSEKDDNESINFSFGTVEEKSSFLLNVIDNLLSNIQNKPSNEVNSFIRRYYTSFFNYSLFTESEHSRSSIQRLFTNRIFISELADHIGLLNLNNQHISFLNRVIYDYYCLSEKDNVVYQKMLQISSFINGNLIIKLSSKMDINNAKLLAMIANSTEEDRVKVHRINLFIINCDIEFTIQNIIDIMFFLYDRFLYPIIFTLLEDESSCIHEFGKGGLQKLRSAIITILLSVPMEKMKLILTDYNYIVISNGINPPVSLKAIKDERLQQCIKELETDPYNLVKEIK